MPDEASLVPCKICGKKFEKVGFHVRKKHSMSMADYRKLPVPPQETIEAAATPPAIQNETVVAAEPVTTTIVETAPATPIEEKAAISDLPWHKRLFYGLSKLLS
jgi:hypothetical protein